MREIFREELLDKADFSIYKLVMLVTKRALEIAEGSPKLIDTGLDDKPISVAMNEISEGRVKYKKTKEK